MNKNEIIETLKSQYNRDLRKQLVRTLLDAEKENNTDKQYKLMNQIFSYVLSQLGWTMAANTENWDPTPLEVMDEVFPKITTSKWFMEQKLITKKHIDLKMGNPE
jgi:hypothetical protein